MMYSLRNQRLVFACLSAVVVHVAAANPLEAASPQPPAKIGWSAVTMDAAAESRIDKLVAASIERGDMSGCVILIGRRAGVACEKAYGNRAVEPTKEAMTTDTLFDMASLTKPLATATSVMILIERGQLRLQDKVAKFFPKFAAKGKENVTVENLLVHSSGLIADNPLSDYSDGWRSAKEKICELELMSDPGTKFKYSDVNYIVLGKIVEAVSGMPENEFVKHEIYDKLGMRDTGYLPPKDLQARAETTEKRDGKWLQGEVHDPRAAKMDGVAGHAGLFSTARDLSVYAQMMLQGGRYGDERVLGAATVEEMIRPRDIGGHRRALGWDKQSGYSRNRGELMSDRAFGHGGFTGTSMWIDPQLDLYVIFLGDRLHPDGAGEVNDLAGRMGTIACAAIKNPSLSASSTPVTRAPLNPLPGAVKIVASSSEPSPSPSLKGRGIVKLGIDVLFANGFKQLDGKRVGLITNQTGVDSNNVTTIDRLHAAKNVKLVALFSPEHGIRGALDQAKIDDSRDEKTGLPVYSLYGERRKPTKEQLQQLDALVFDVQDVGSRFYTNTATMALSLDAATEVGKEFVILDRPNPIGGEIVEGPLLDKGKESFVGIHDIPLRYGLTIGEFAKMYVAERKIDAKLTVVPVEGWRREMYQFDTNQRWVNTSPNMRSLRAAVLYVGIGMMEFTNISVGRGTETPFELLGAPWIQERDLALAVNDAQPPGVRVVPIRFTPNASTFKGEECRGLGFVITDWDKFRSFEFGLIVAHSLHKLYPDKWEPERLMRLLGSQKVYRQIVDGAAVSDILKSVSDDEAKFRERRKPFLLYE